MWLTSSVVFLVFNELKHTWSGMLLTLNEVSRSKREPLERKGVLWHTIHENAPWESYNKDSANRMHDTQNPKHGVRVLGV